MFKQDAVSKKKKGDEVRKYALGCLATNIKAIALGWNRGSSNRLLSEKRARRKCEGEDEEDEEVVDSDGDDESEEEVEEQTPEQVAAAKVEAMKAGRDKRHQARAEVSFRFRVLSIFSD